LSKQPLYVIKIGGNVIDDAEKLSAFIRAFAAINGHKILVHGGGKLATRLAEQLGIEQQVVDGRRITDTETLRVVTMVYAGYVNKTLVAQLQAAGSNAIGLTGADGNAILAHKRQHPAIDYGFVGDIDSVNAAWLHSLLREQIDIVMAPITHDAHGQLLNTNADTIAQEIAVALSEYYTVDLIYCFEKPGVLSNAADESSVIGQIDPNSYLRLREEKLIFAGMIPKLDNAFRALEKGVRQVMIGKAEELSLVIERKSGTAIVPHT